ncbi:MAG: hypothetical protein QOI47_1879 [Actinomycetota bacterium]|nr:hypothetical protein [Actinomycetota bacterium]
MHAIERHLARVPVAVLALACGLWIALTDRVAETPHISTWVRVARAFPHSAHLPRSGTYIESSPLGPAIAHALGADRTSSAYASLHLVIVIVCVAIAVLAVARRFGAMAGRLSVAAIFASPLSNLLLTWLGQPDPMTLAGGVLAAVSTSPALLFAAAAIVAFNHQEQAVVMLAGVLVVRHTVGDLRVRQGAAVIAGIVVGAIGIALFKWHFGIEGSRFAAAGRHGPADLLRDFGATWPVVLLASFGATWLIVVGLGRHLPARGRLVLGTVIAGMMVISIFTLDTTRVFSIVSMPVVIVLIGYASTTVSRPALERILLVAVAAGLLYPHVVVWEGNIYVSSIGRSVRWLVRG